MRVAEAHEVIQIMTRLSTGEHSIQNTDDGFEFDWSRWSSIDPHKPVMVGHSLGGSAAVRVLFITSLKAEY